MIINFKKLFSGIIFLLCCSLLATADSGCFTYSESALYCNDLTLEQAQQECHFYSDCNLEKNYLSIPCSENAACEKILCKSTCREEFRSKCPSGELPPEEKVAWCTPGCCQFQYMGGEYCQNKNSKWLCQVESQNKDAPKFIFDLSSKGLPCEQRCSGSKVEDFLQGTSENEKVLISPLVTFDQEKKGSVWGFYLTIILIILIIFGIYLWKKRKLTLPQEKKETPFTKREVRNIPLPKIFQWFSPFQKALPEKHHRKEKERQKFFLATGMTPLPVKSEPKESRHTQKLSKLAQRYSLPFVKSKAVPEKPWKRLNEITLKPQKVEEKPVQKVEIPRASDNLESLRKIVPSKPPENPAWERLRKIGTKK